MPPVPFGPSKNMKKKQPLNRFDLGYACVQRRRHNHYTTVSSNRRVAEIQIFEKTYLIVIKDETGLKFKMNDSTLFLIGSYAQKLVASY